MQFELLKDRFVHHGTQVTKGQIICSTTPMDEVFGTETFRRVDTPSRATIAPGSDPEPDELEESTTEEATTTPRVTPSKPSKQIVGKKKKRFVRN